MRWPALLVAVRCCAAYSSYRERIPNGYSVPSRGGYTFMGVGHTRIEGGGALNRFGRDFRDAGYTWTLELCLKDSDGDGETNGHELGDPCCTWQQGGAPPARAWRLSHPGDVLAVTGDQPREGACGGGEAVAAAARFWRFYDGETTLTQHALNNSGADVRRVQAALRLTAQHDAREREAARGRETSVASKALHGGATRNASSLALLALLVGCCMFRVNAARRRPAAASRGHARWQRDALLALAALVWCDIASGVLHIVLDNPRINKWPVIGAEARSFQGHHFDPPAVARGALLPFVAQVHPVALLVTSTVLLAPRSALVPRGLASSRAERAEFGARERGELATFFVCINVGLTLAMLAHRWAHAPSDAVPRAARALQRLGLLIDRAHHAEHHMDYTRNFSIMMGRCDPLLNWLTARALPAASTAWIVVLLAWGFAPLALAWAATLSRRAEAPRADDVEHDVERSTRDAAVGKAGARHARPVRSRGALAVGDK